MVVEVSNPANKNMHYGDKPVVANLQTPDKLPSRVIYSGLEGRKQYEQMEADIYEGIRKTKPVEKHKFPAILKWAIGIGVAISAFCCRKNIAKFFKKIF